MISNPTTISRIEQAIRHYKIRKVQCETVSTLALATATGFTLAAVCQFIVHQAYGITATLAVCSLTFGCLFRVLARENELYARKCIEMLTTYRALTNDTFNWL